MYISCPVYILCQSLDLQCNDVLLCFDSHEKERHLDLRRGSSGLPQLVQQGLLGSAPQDLGLHLARALALCCSIHASSLGCPLAPTPHFSSRLVQLLQMTHCCWCWPSVHVLLPLLLLQELLLLLGA